MFTKTDIVNACLIAIGNDKVPDLDFPDTDTDIAISVVDETIVDVLSQGWYFNQEPNWRLRADPSGEIKLPNTIISFRTSGNSKRVDLVKRAGKAYDITNHTFNLNHLTDNNGYITFNMVITLDIEDCPVPAQQYIRQRSISKFLFALKADATKIQISEKEEIRYLAILERHHRRWERDNAYESPRVNAMMTSMESPNSLTGMYDEILNPLGGRE